MAVLALVVALGPGAAPARAQATSPTPIQDRYAAPGPSAVRHQTFVGPGGAAQFELYVPADLGAPGDRHPVITWGNGSFELPGKYEPLLRHLASWGFIVIGAATTEAGTGEEMLAAVRHVVELDGDPESALHQRVDHGNVGAVGHSQGAGGSTRAASAPGSPITTVVTVALPHQLFAIPPDTKGIDPSRLAVPVLFLGAEWDQLISGTTTNRAYFDSVRGAAAMAMLRGAEHNTVQGTAGGFPGYITAWMRYQLSGDPVAAGAFTGPDPELLTAPGWYAQALKGLAAPALAEVDPVAEPTTTTTSTVVPTTTAAPGPQLPVTGPSVPFPLVALLLATAAALTCAPLRRTPTPPRGGGRDPGPRRP